MIFSTSFKRMILSAWNFWEVHGYRIFPLRLVKLGAYSILSISRYIPVSNEPTERATEYSITSYISYIRIPAIGSPRNESSRARERDVLRYSRWSLSSSVARWHQGQAAQDFSQRER